MNPETKSNMQGVALVAAAYISLWAVSAGLAGIIDSFKDTYKEQQNSPTSPSKKHELTIEQKIALALKIAKGEDGVFQPEEKRRFADFFGHPKNVNYNHIYSPNFTSMNIQQATLVGSYTLIILISDDPGYTSIEEPEIDRYLETHQSRD